MKRTLSFIFVLIAVCLFAQNRNANNNTNNSNSEYPTDANDHFRGTIDGNNKTISNLFIDYKKEHDSSYIVGNARAGLIGQMATGTIKNLVVKGSIRNV